MGNLEALQSSSCAWQSAVFMLSSAISKKIPNISQVILRPQESTAWGQRGASTRGHNPEEDFALQSCALLSLLVLPCCSADWRFVSFLFHICFNIFGSHVAA